MSTTSTIKGVNDIAREMSSASGIAPPQQTIDWDNYNYPPLIRIMHFNLNELEGSARRVVRLCHWAFLLIIITLLVNRARLSGVRAHNARSRDIPPAQSPLHPVQCSSISSSPGWGCV